ncbi:hypothetical protein Brsp04_02045 [Brucella sp. NBRC 12952]
MAFVTDTYDFALPRGISIPNPFVFKGILRVAALLGAGLLAGSCLMTTLSTVEAVLPAFVPLAPAMRRLPAATPHQLAVVDQKIGMGHVIRQRFIEAYTADAPYSNLDWRRSKVAEDAPIIADVGPEAVIEAEPVAMAAVIEPRAERVAPPAPAQDVVSLAVIASATSAAQTAAQDYSASAIAALPSGDAIPVPMAAPDAQIARAPIEDDTDSFLPDDVPFPGQKPVIDRPTVTKPQKQEKTQLAYAPPSGQTENIQRGLFGRLFGQAAHNKTAIYDISAATVCQVAKNWKRIRAWATCATIRAMLTRRCVALRHRALISFRCVKAYSTGSKQCVCSQPMVAIRTTATACWRTHTCCAGQGIQTVVWCLRIMPASCAHSNAVK